MAGDIFCIAETRKGQVAQASFETLKGARVLADALGKKVVAVAIGSGVKACAKDLGERGADTVYTADHAALADFNDDLYAGALGGLIAQEQPAAVLFAATTFGRCLAARTAPAVKYGLAADVSALKADGGKITATRACFGGSGLADVTAKGPFMATLSKGAFARAEAQAGRAFEAKDCAFDPAAVPAKLKFLGKTAEEDGQKDITQSEVIVSGGYGLGKAEGFKLLEELAKLLGGAVGASRRAVDIGWIPYRHQVGLTGRSVKPKLYIAVGISGQIQHIAGMGQSDNIVAINSDPEAPLMKMATYAVVGDLYQIVPALIEAIKKERG